MQTNHLPVAPSLSLRSAMYLLLHANHPHPVHPAHHVTKDYYASPETPHLKKHKPAHQRPDLLDNLCLAIAPSPCEPNYLTYPQYGVTFPPSLPLSL